MSRSGYSDELTAIALKNWRGAVASAIRGQRGQAFLREMLAALDALPAPRLIENDLASDEGVCAIGSVGRARGLAMRSIDPEDRRDIAKTFGIAEALVAEIEFINDDDFCWDIADETPELRFQRVRKWVVEQIKP